MADHPRKPSLVMKFGGTSVADEKAIRRVVDIVRDARDRTEAPPIVVVSAMSGVTDDLLRLAHRASRGEPPAEASEADALRRRHLEAAEALAASDAKPALIAEIETVFAELCAILTAFSVLREASPRSLDAVAATGELVSSRVVTAALSRSGVDAAWIDARRAIVTDDAFGGAAPLESETLAALRREIAPRIAAGRAAVVGGYVGATRDRVTTTLGRGGSDYSASIIGAALGAPEIQIWTDVDGMLTADPRLVENPQVVPHLSFAEASELAYFGAKVLHPSTILPAVAAGVPVRILNSQKPGGAGTRIGEMSGEPRRAVSALACKRRVTVVDVTSTRMLMAHRFLRRLFEVFERYRTAVDVVTTSEVSVSVTIDDDRRLEEIVAAIREFAEVSVEREMAILCAVGEGLRADPRLAAEMLAELTGLPLRMVSQAASRRNLTVVLHDRDLPEAMSRLHEREFRQPAPTVSR